MENVNVILANNIQAYRKKAGLTQDALADRLGVTFQAVSKWENAKAAPDVSLLPSLADIFGCSIDELFSHKVKRVTDVEGCITIYGDVEDGCVCPSGSITVNGNVIGDCTSRGDITVNGNITGECVANGNINAKEYIIGECVANGNINAKEGIIGECNVGGEIVATSILDGSVIRKMHWRT